MVWILNGTAPDVETGKDYISWWYSRSRTSPGRELGQLLQAAELSPGFQAELHLWAPAGSQKTGKAPTKGGASTDGAFTTPLIGSL